MYIGMTSVCMSRDNDPPSVSNFPGPINDFCPLDRYCLSMTGYAGVGLSLRTGTSALTPAPICMVGAQKNLGGAAKCHTAIQPFDCIDLTDNIDGVL